MGDTFTLRDAADQSSESAGHSLPEPAAPSPLLSGVVSIDIAALRTEMNGYYAEAKEYKGWEPSQVLLHISGVSARLMEMRAALIRCNNKAATSFRTQEVDKLIEHLDMQFKIHSRLLTSRELEFKMSGGQV